MPRIFRREPFFPQTDVPMPLFKDILGGIPFRVFPEGQFIRPPGGKKCHRLEPRQGSGFAESNPLPLFVEMGAGADAVGVPVDGAPRPVNPRVGGSVPANIIRQVERGAVEADRTAENRKIGGRVGAENLPARQPVAAPGIASGTKNPAGGISAARRIGTTSRRKSAAAAARRRVERRRMNSNATAKKIR